MPATLVLGCTSESLFGKLNASYAPSGRSFLLFKRSRFEGIPIGANLPVLAHETGHAVFVRRVFETAEHIPAADQWVWDDDGATG